MKIVRFSSQAKASYGILENGTVKGIQGSSIRNLMHSLNFPRFNGKIYSLDTIRLLPPCTPSKLVCLGLNYRSHAEEFGLPIPSTPLIFLKPSTAIIGPFDSIILPRNSKRVDYEAELGIVIGRNAKDIKPEKAHEYILGYTCVNDVTERHNQKDDGQWTRAKGYDTLAPIGPCIETDVSADNTLVESILNGEIRQSAQTSDLIFGVTELVSFISSVMTLLPGDIIATGTPSGVGQLEANDTIDIRIEGIGTLTNYARKYNDSIFS